MTADTGLLLRRLDQRLSLFGLARATDPPGQVARPVVHQDTPAVEQVRAGIGRLDHFPGMIGLLGRPVPEAGPEPVWHGCNPLLADQPPQLLVVNWLPAPACEHQRTAHPSPSVRVAKGISTSAQRHQMLPVRLHPLGRDGPYTFVAIDLQ